MIVLLNFPHKFRGANYVTCACTIDCASNGMAMDVKPFCYSFPCSSRSVCEVVLFYVKVKLTIDVKECYFDNERTSTQALPQASLLARLPLWTSLLACMFIT